MRLLFLTAAACLLLSAQTASPPARPQGDGSTVTVRATPSPVVTAGVPAAGVCSIPLLEARKGDPHDRIGRPLPPARTADPIRVKPPAPPCDAKSK
ncbi:MAG TPA: hypothetical protein VMU19_13895 [Bryobacteraceae bacterium]|nr:hypothetical protein [Bryobacteraceae bacterium]